MKSLRRYFRVDEPRVLIGQGVTRSWRGTAGHHSDGLAGITDLLGYSHGASVFDIGCNRGLLGFEFARSGAALVHGCDLFETGIKTAREVFSEMEAKSRFEIVDLTKGPSALSVAFGNDYQAQYDIVLFLAIYNKLRAQMPRDELHALIRHIVDRTRTFLACRVRHEEMEEVDAIFTGFGLRRVQLSTISKNTGPVGIWQKHG